VDKLNLRVFMRNSLVCATRLWNTLSDRRVVSASEWSTFTRIFVGGHRRRLRWVEARCNTFLAFSAIADSPYGQWKS